MSLEPMGILDFNKNLIELRSIVNQTLMKDYAVASPGKNLPFLSSLNENPNYWELRNPKEFFHFGLVTNYNNYY